MRTAITIVHIIIAIALVIVVLFQNGKDAGLSGVIGGESSESFYGKNKGKSMNAILSKLTVILAALFIVTSVVLSIVFR